MFQQYEVKSNSYRGMLREDDDDDDDEDEQPYPKRRQLSTMAQAVQRKVADQSIAVLPIHLHNSNIFVAHFAF